MNKIETKKVVIAAGGTGGHIFPALVVAKKLEEHGISIYWIGTRKGLEANIIPKANITINYISVEGIRGKNLLTLLLAPYKIIVSIVQAVYFIKKINPNLVIGMGGFVSGPVGIAAFLLRKKLIIHEQNSIAGTTNKILTHFATKVLYAFPNAFKNYTDNTNSLNNKYILIGNPVREEFSKIIEPRKRLKNDYSSFNILVLGGSGGAKALNECIPTVVKLWQEKTLGMKESQPTLHIWHQTGTKLYLATQELYKKLELENNNIKIVPFIDNMVESYLWADVVICRSGALTVAELAASGVASILIPFPYAIDDHQTTNAQYLVKNKAAVLIPQSSLSPEKLYQELYNLVVDKKSLLNMATNAYALANKNALNESVDICLQYC